MVVSVSSFVVEMDGFDLSLGLSKEQCDNLRVLLYTHQVLVFRSQRISPRDHVRLTSHLGPIEPGLARRPESHKVPGFPDLLLLSNRPGSPTLKYGMSWHSDGLAYARAPHELVILHCLACPEGVGATLFADQFAAYDSLPSYIQREIRDVYWYLPKMPFSEVPSRRGLAQPMVRTQPDCSRTYLFCAPNVNQLRGWSRSESAALLSTIRAHQIGTQAIYRHQWRPGDVIIWENSTVLHNRADKVDYHRHGPRALHRCATQGVHMAVECEPAEDAHEVANIGGI